MHDLRNEQGLTTMNLVHTLYNLHNTDSFEYPSTLPPERAVEYGRSERQARQRRLEDIEEMG